MTRLAVLACLLASISFATACGGEDDEAALAPTTGQTTLALPDSEGLNREAAELQTLVDENLAKIEASTNKQEMEQAVAGFTSALADTEARLRQLDVPPELTPATDALLGAVANVQASMGDVTARLESSTVAETKSFLQSLRALVDLRAAIAVIQQID
jgi:hypothetical protein